MIILSVFTLVNALFSITPFEHAHQFVFILIHISQIHKANIGAVCVESRPHPDFLGPRWWEDMALIIQELKKYKRKRELLRSIWGRFTTQRLCGWMAGSWEHGSARPFFSMKLPSPKALMFSGLKQLTL